MSDWLTKEQRTRNMGSIRSKGNRTTEIRLVMLMRQQGITGWRRHIDLPGKPDFIFRKGKLAVFVDGCFWHACPRCYRPPDDNRSYWQAKAESNIRRDRLSTKTLRSAGWTVVRLWEHQLKDPKSIKHIFKFMESKIGSKG